MARNTDIPLRLVQGTTAQIDDTTGAVGEVFIDTERRVLVVQDGVTRGGFPQARADEVVKRAGDTMSGPLKIPTPAAGINDTTAVNAAWVNGVIWGKTVAGQVPSDISSLVADMPVGAFLAFPDVVADVPSTADVNALAARVAQLEASSATKTALEAALSRIDVLEEEVAALKARAVSVYAAALPANPDSLISGLPLGGFVCTDE